MSDESTPGAQPERALEIIDRLHTAIDTMTAPLLTQHTARLQCRRGCSACCADDLSVFEVEAARIRHAFADLLATGTPGPEGMCAMLDDEGACRIYAHRPYVCRTQGLPLRWLELDEREEVVELRAICPLNELPDAPLSTLDEAACWTIGPAEQQLQGIQRLYAGDDQARRVRLRDLFDRETSS